MQLRNPLKTNTRYLCKFHLITDENEYHCGVVNDEKTREVSLKMASDFYNIFKLVSKQSNKQNILNFLI